MVSIYDVIIVIVIIFDLEKRNFEKIKMISLEKNKLFSSHEKLILRILFSGNLCVSSQDFLKEEKSKIKKSYFK
jgi:hypothetical protein